MNRFVGAALLVLSAGCGSSSPTAPSVAQVAGVWRGTDRLTAASGGECFAANFQGTIGTTDNVTAAITQTGSNLNLTLTSQSTGGICTYSGTAGTAAVVLTLNSCTASDLFGARCSTGAVRDIRVQTGTLNATLSGSTLNGTSATTYNVLVSGTTSPVGTLTLNTTFTVTRQ